MAGRPIDMKEREKQKRRVDAAIAKLNADGVEIITKSKIANMMGISRSAFTSGYLADYLDSLGVVENGTVMMSDAEKITRLETKLLKTEEKLAKEKEKHRQDNILHTEKIAILQAKLLDEKIKNEELRDEIYEQDKMRITAI